MEILAGILHPEYFPESASIATVRFTTDDTQLTEKHNR
jgi:hypothetical protein